MNLLRRLVAAMVMLLATLGIVSCVAGIVGIWMARQYASEKVPSISSRLDGGLERVSGAIQDVQRALETARAEVAKFSKDSVIRDGGDAKERLADSLRRRTRQQIGSRVDDLGGRLATLSDAAVVVSSLLQGFQELPFARISSTTQAKLERASGQASKLSGALQQLRPVADDGDTATIAKEDAATTRKLDLVLREGQDTMNEWQSDVDSARQELSRAKTEILGWLTPVAIAVTVLCVWLCLSQVSLLVHAWKWCRG